MLFLFTPLPWSPVELLLGVILILNSHKTSYGPSDITQSVEPFHRRLDRQAILTSARHSSTLLRRPPRPRRPLRRATGEVLCPCCSSPPSPSSQVSTAQPRAVLLDLPSSTNPVPQSTLSSDEDSQVAAVRPSSCSPECSSPSFGRCYIFAQRRHHEQAKCWN
ncbi:hypothetical protein F5B17DRAFT_2465 [Nemania serpens]|nr:hypothetical protein F5B17DRAFT_2465 [Nemania serpens]